MAALRCNKFLLRYRDAGFTLIEVLIALAIIAIALTAIIKATSNDIIDTQTLQNKSIAHWVAMNSLSEIQLGMIPLTSGSQRSGTTSMLNQDWFWNARVTTTADKHVAKVIISVRKANGNNTVDTVQGYLLQ